MDIPTLEVYELTPMELLIIAKKQERVAKDKLVHDISIAYFAEVFARSKRLPKLEKIVGSIEKPKKKKLSKGDMLLKAMAKEKGIILE